MKINSSPKAIALVGALFFSVTGVWAFAAPESFFDTVATYPPYNEHLFHDLGAFQVGLAAALFAGLVRADGLFAVLAGASAGSILHALAHFMDTDLGGRSSDPWLLSAFAGLLVVGAVQQARRSNE